MFRKARESTYFEELDLWRKCLCCILSRNHCSHSEFTQDGFIGTSTVAVINTVTINYPCYCVGKH